MADDPDDPDPDLHCLLEDHTLHEEKNKCDQWERKFELSWKKTYYVYQSKFYH